MMSLYSNLVETCMWTVSGDGQVDAREFHQALERLNINIRKKEVYSVLAFLDVNHDNRIQVGIGD